MKPEPFAPWQCPLCGEPLTGDTALKCGRNHSFDRAKEGYWHLLPVQSMRTKAPGDSKRDGRRPPCLPERRVLRHLRPGAGGTVPCVRRFRRGQMHRSTCWMRAAARAGMTAALHRPLRRRAGRCSWRVLISQSLRCVWPQRHCLPQNTRWHPVLPSLSAPDGPTCCSTASRPLHRKSSGACCARADG